MVGSEGRKGTGPAGPIHPLDFGRGVGLAVKASFPPPLPAGSCGIGFSYLSPAISSPSRDSAGHSAPGQPGHAPTHPIPPAQPASLPRWQRAPQVRPGLLSPVSHVLPRAPAISRANLRPEYHRNTLSRL